MISFLWVLCLPSTFLGLVGYTTMARSGQHKAATRKLTPWMIFSVVLTTVFFLLVNFG